MTSQIRRAVAAVPANIAEGCGRSGDGEFGRFLQIAAGSASELDYHLLLARDLGYLVEPEYRKLYPATQEIKRMFDGPFLHRTAGGHLLMVWSSIGHKGYAMGIARSLSGEVTGPWVQSEQAFWEEDGGHGMIFRAFDGRLFITLHRPNNSPNERAYFFEIEEVGETLVRK